MESSSSSSSSSSAEDEFTDDLNTSCPRNMSLQNPFQLPLHLELMYGLLFFAMVLVAVGGNAIVMWIVLAHKRMRTVTNYFLVNLAASDAMITIFNTMFNFIYMARSHWPFGYLYCKFITFIVPCTIASSVFTFIAIALERYMAIVHPLRPRLGAKKVLGIIFGIWVVSVLIAMPCLLFAEIHVHRCQLGRTVCYMEWPGDDNPNDQEFRYNLFLLIITYILPLIILAFTYARVGVELWGGQAIGEVNSRQLESVKSKKRVVKMMVAVVVIFGVCWLPQNAFLLIQYQEAEITSNTWFQHVALMTYWLAMSNSMYNPIIYCWMNTRFRSGFKYALRWMPCIKWESSDAGGFWGFTGIRFSTTEHTRCAYQMNDINSKCFKNPSTHKADHKTRLDFHSEFKTPELNM